MTIKKETKKEPKILKEPVVAKGSAFFYSGETVPRGGQPMVFSGIWHLYEDSTLKSIYDTITDLNKESFNAKSVVILSLSAIPVKG